MSLTGYYSKHHERLEMLPAAMGSSYAWRRPIYRAPRTRHLSIYATCKVVLSHISLGTTADATNQVHAPYDQKPVFRDKYHDPNGVNHD